MAVTNMDEEAAEVQVLQSKLAKTTDLTNKISLSLAKLTASATNVEQAVKPIYAKTQTLTVLSANIDATIAAIEKIRKPLDVVSTEESTIRAGPQKTGLTGYLASLKRINEALMHIKGANLRSQQMAMGQMTTLLKTGSLELENLFRQTLAEESNPVEPLHYITKELPFPTFSPKALNILAVLNDFLSSTLASACGLQSNATSIYSDLRGIYLTNTLSSLSQASVNTAQRRGQSTPYDKGSNGIVIYTQALEAIFTAEWENICHVFPSSSWPNIYADTIQSPMKAFGNTVRELNNHVKANLITDCFLAFDVLDNVHPAMARLANKTGEKEGFVEALKPIKSTAQSSFQELLEDVKRKSQVVQTLPPDNGVLELTVNVMQRLRRLTDYKVTVTSLLIAIGDNNWNRPSSSSLPSIGAPTLFDVSADGNVLLSHFISDVVEALLSQLEARARLILKKNATVAVFMINNTAYIESVIKKSDLWSVMNPATATSTAGSANAQQGMKKIEQIRKKFVEMYLEGWKECAAHLMDVTYIKQGAKVSISSKDKEAAKEKFKSFNTAFDELVLRHKQYNFPDKDVRQMLVKEVSFIGPLYGRFYDKYKDIMRDKYIKYDKQTLDQNLSNL